jgi:hypothetical protein
MLDLQGMRFVGRTITLKQVFESKLTFILLLALVGYMLYLNSRTVPFAFKMKDRVQTASAKFATAKGFQTETEFTDMTNSSDEAKLRYKKQFFNNLEEGEYVVFLHKEDVKKESQIEEVRKLTPSEIYTQKVKLWWKNLDY